MTVYLWLRHLDGSILERSPEVISLRKAAAREGPRNPQYGVLIPDDDGFVESTRRSSRKSVPTLPSTQAETPSGTARRKTPRETPKRGETREQLRKKKQDAKNGAKNDKTPKDGKARENKRKQVEVATPKAKKKVPKSAAILKERGRTREEERTRARVDKAVAVLEQFRGKKPGRGETSERGQETPERGETTEGQERPLEELKRGPSQANDLVPAERSHRDERQNQPSPEICSQSPRSPDLKRKTSKANTLVPLVPVQEHHRPSREQSPEIHSQSPHRPISYPRGPSRQTSPEIHSQFPSWVPPSWQSQQQHANLVEAMKVQVSQRDALIAALQGEAAAKEAQLKAAKEALPREPVQQVLQAITDTHQNVVAIKQLELIAQMQRQTQDADLAKRIKKAVKDKTAKKQSLKKTFKAGYKQKLKAKQRAAEDLRQISAATSVSQHSGKANSPSKRSRSRSMRGRSKQYSRSPSRGKSGRADRQSSSLRQEHHHRKSRSMRGPRAQQSRIKYISIIHQKQVNKSQPPGREGRSRWRPS